MPTLTDQQKKILAVAFLALSCLAACYAIYNCVYKNTRLATEKDSESKSSPAPVIPLALNEDLKEEQIEMASQLHTEKDLELKLIPVPTIPLALNEDLNEEQIEMASQLHNDAKASKGFSLEKALEMVKIAGKYLISLNLNHTDITAEQLKEIREARPNLKHLNLTLGKQVNDVINLSFGFFSWEIKIFCE